MSHSATVDPDKHEGLKLLFERVEFDPTPLFAPRSITLNPPKGNPSPFPTPPPAILTVVPVVHNGNILMLIRDVIYNDNLPHPTWRVTNSVLNVDGSVSVVLESSLQDLIVLTSGGGKHTWSSTFFPDELGKWSAQPQTLASGFTSRFTWTFLLQPSDDDPVTVVLGFVIFVGPPKIGILQQVSSFPEGWVATSFGESNGIFFTLVGPPPDFEKYSLRGGFFVGGLGALVCQGKIPGNDSSHPPAPFNGAFVTNSGNGKDDGTWTGTSGGPVPTPPS